MGWPTTTEPKTEFVTLRLTVAEMADLDQYTSTKGFKGRSAAVRDAVSRVIAAEKKREKRQRGRLDATGLSEDA